MSSGINIVTVVKLDLEFRFADKLRWRWNASAKKQLQPSTLACITDATKIIGCTPVVRSTRGIILSIISTVAGRASGPRPESLTRRRLTRRPLHYRRDNTVSRITGCGLQPPGGRELCRQALLFTCQSFRRNISSHCHPALARRSSCD